MALIIYNKCMDKIYLGIIITYLVFKTIPIILSGSKAYKLMGYKRIFIDGLPFIIRKLSPLDFIEEKTGLPITFFNLAKGQTLWEQMQVDDNKKGLTEKEILEKLDMAKLICSKGVVYFPGNLKADDFFNLKISPKTAKISWTLYALVVGYNFPTFKKAVYMDKNNVLHIAELCARFGKKPSDHIKPKGGLSELEEYMIDEFFYNQILIKHNLEIQKQNEAIKKRNKR